MPLYRHKCPECKEVVEELRPIKEWDVLPTCLKCRVEMPQEVTSVSAKIFKPITLEHINVTGEGPLTFEKERDLRKYCRDNHLHSNALL